MPVKWLELLSDDGDCETQIRQNPVIHTTAPERNHREKPSGMLASTSANTGPLQCAFMLGPARQSAATS